MGHMMMMILSQVRRWMKPIRLYIPCATAAQNASYTNNMDHDDGEFLDSHRCFGHVNDKKGIVLVKKNKYRHIKIAISPVHVEQRTSLQGYPMGKSFLIIVTSNSLKYNKESGVGRFCVHIVTMPSYD